MANGLDHMPWEEVGTEEDKRLLSTCDELRLKMKEGLGGASAPGIPDFEDRRWKYEFCILRMFWIWYVANSPKLTNAGATKQLLDAYNRSSNQAMEEAGVVAGSEEDVCVWGGALLERFAAYKVSYESVQTSRAFFPLVPG